MKIRFFIRRYLFALLFALSLICAALSLTMPSYSVDTGKAAARLSRTLDERMEKLDGYIAALAAHPARNGVWPSLDDDFPDDMVIYRYCADTLHSWYNVLSSMPNIDEFTQTPAYVQNGRKWYIAKVSEIGKEKFLGALTVKDAGTVNVTGGQKTGGIGKRFHLHGNFDIVSPDKEGAVPVSAGGVQVFSIEQISGQEEDNPLNSIWLRWLSMSFLVIAAFVYLRSNRSTANCTWTVLLLMTIAFAMHRRADMLAEYSMVFSPVLYAHDGILNSFGALLIFNTILSLIYFAVFMCRRELAVTFASSGRKRTVYLLVLIVVFLTQLAYIFYTLSTLVNNSGISLELYKLSMISGYTLVAYLSYAFLSVSLMLLLDTILEVVNRAKGTSYTMLKITPMLVFCSLAAAGMLATVSVLGFKKEKNQVAGWSNRLSVDRNLSFEMALREIEDLIAGDPLIDVLCHSGNTEALVIRRIEELMGRNRNQASVSVNIVTGDDKSLIRYMDELLSKGVSISPGSRFIYNKMTQRGSFYTAVFSYYSKEYGQARLLLEVVPKITDNVQIPPSYSYARYEEGRLSSFSGTYAYPTVTDVLADKTLSQETSYVYNGYRHFVNRISDDELVVVSRKTYSVPTYLVTFTYLLFLLYFIGLLFRRRNRNEMELNGRFQKRMLSLVTVSLTVTLVVMATVSVVFVYGRNEQNTSNAMIARISAIQGMMDGLCRQCQSSDDLQSPEFRSELDGISRNLSSPLNVYSSGGALLVSTSRYTELKALIPSEAYRTICLEYQRYYIDRKKGLGYDFYILYAPIINASGRVVGIVSAPYTLRDYDFTRDAVFHAATVVSLFLILLFITIVIAYRIIGALFKPMIDMSRKMSSLNATKLELIEYDGDDEISALVKAYNRMVRDLEESTDKLAAAERDKAWSEMARQVAHEIKNPLTPIKLEIQRLQRLKQKNAPGWEEKFDTVSKIILEHIDILTLTANEFSTFAKLYSEPSTVIDLDRTLKEQILLFENRGVAFTYLGVEGATVSGPKPQLIRVFVNLLTNAVQAVEQVENPRIIVSLRKGKDSGWDIVFEDNGPGVSEENQSRLFTPNFTTKSSGTGLGLAICRSIVDRCGGSISYSRSFTLSGACFTVFLP